MNVEETIRRRRSVRSYSLKVPKDEDVRSILEAARWAPSGLNNQPWKFAVVRDKKKDGLAEFTEYGSIINNAPIAICVFLDKSASYSREKDIMAVGACIQNMLLCAQARGLETCWLGQILNKKKEVQAYLKSPFECELMAVVTLGYPNKKAAKGKRKSLRSFLIEYGKK